MENKAKELIYKPAPFWKRITAFLLDAVLVIMLAFTFFSLLNMGIQQTDFVKDNANKRLEIQNESGLYVEGNNIVTYVESNETLFSSYREKKEYLSSKLDSFYTSSRFFDDSSEYNDYQKRKLDYKYNDLFLFEKNSEGVVVEITASPQYFYEFYKEEVNNYALPSLYKIGEYANTTAFSLVVMIVEFSVCLTVSSFIFLLVIPMWVFKRGRATLGMKVLHIGLISVKAVNVKGGSFFLRFLFIYFVYIILGFFAFLVPELISLGMLAFSKRRQDLVDYVLNHYQVDVTDQEIYLDLGDYYLHMQKKKQAKLENNDLELTNSRNGDIF